MIRSHLKTWVAAIGIVFLLIPLESKVGAAPLNLVPVTPVIDGVVSTSYDATSDTLVASGLVQLFLVPPIEIITGGTFDLIASIDSSGAASAGTLSIGGTIATLGFNSGTLLTGTLSDFGAGAVDPLEFLFDVTGGDAAALYDSTVGVILSFSGYTGSFASDFSSAPLNTFADAFAISETVIPLPAAAWLMLTGLGGLGLLGWRRKRTATA